MSMSLVCHRCGRDGHSTPRVGPTWNCALSLVWCAGHKSYACLCERWAREQQRGVDWQRGMRLVERHT